MNTDSSTNIGLTGHPENIPTSRVSTPPGPFSRRWRTRCEVCLRTVPAWVIAGRDDVRQVASHQPPADPNGCCRCEGSLTLVPFADCLDSAAMARLQAVTGPLPVVAAAAPAAPGRHP